MVNFDPEEPDADIEGWCKLTDVIVKGKNISGMDLKLALTKALKGRFFFSFSKPMTMQDYFNQVIKFQLAKDESVTQGGLRLWQLFENMPDATMS